ncbi:putative glutathione transferase [Helianthus annuus]|uniref:Glutathione transferase n=1 Tax=Helianthus annuus TaxID=4232 RepID=A0A9K3HYC6_HELAN|nr:putative glutathione transferase [Helianthus annuus]KAJ0879994.1 putative glutathione transferase [Helianthus annuus]
MSSIEESEVVLLGWWASMYTSRVGIALSEKRINYENIEQDIVNKGPLLLKHNPIYKKVPVFIHKGNLFVTPKSLSNTSMKHGKKDTHCYLLILISNLKLRGVPTLSQGWADAPHEKMFFCVIFRRKFRPYPLEFFTRTP